MHHDHIVEPFAGRSAPRRMSHEKAAFGLVNGIILALPFWAVLFSLAQ